METYQMALEDKKYLYAVGCSHFAGSEIDGPEQSTRTANSLNKAIPGRLAKHFNLNYINVAKPAGSNGFIYRTVIEIVQEWIHKGRDPSELFFVLGWSTDERYEFTWEGEHWHWANGKDSSLIHKGGIGPDFTNWFKALQLYNTDFMFGAHKKLLNIITLHEYLSSRNIQYVQLASCGKIDPSTWEDNECILHDFPYHTYFEPTDSFIDQYLDMEAEHFTPWLHADAYLHNKHAEKLINFIETNYE